MRLWNCEIRQSMIRELISFVFILFLTHCETAVPSKCIHDEVFNAATDVNYSPPLDPDVYDYLQLQPSSIRITTDFSQISNLTPSSQDLVARLVNITINYFA